MSSYISFFFFFKSRFSRRKEAETSEHDVATTVVRQPWKEKEALEDIFSGRRKRIIVGSVYKDISISHTTIILDPFPDFPLLICFPCSWTSSLDKKSIRNFRVWESFKVYFFFCRIDCSRFIYDKLVIIFYRWIFFFI